MQEKDVLREEHARLQADLKGERRRADRLQEELGAFRLRWWARWTDSRTGEEGGADERTAQ